MSPTWLSDFTFTFHFHALEKEMATHSSVLAWRLPGTGEPGGLPSMGSHRVGHDWSDLAAAGLLWKSKRHGGIWIKLAVRLVGVKAHVTELKKVSTWLSCLRVSCMLCMLSNFSRVWLFVNLWTVAHQAPLPLGILQARILKWVAVPSSRGSSQPRNRTPDLIVSCTGRWVLYHQHHHQH